MAYEFIDDTGVILANTSAVQTEVEDEYKAVFGDDLDLDPETPEGLLISAETTSRVGIATNNAQLANEINPNLAGGVFLDALWALTGGARAAATRSTLAAVNLTGVSGTLIPAGSIAATTAGDDFQTTSAVTITGGVAVVGFESVETGPIPALAGTLTTIVTGILGWETVSNPTGATLGIVQQSDVSARSERGQTLGVQGSGLSVAVFSKVRAVAGVTSLTFRENETNVPIVVTPPDNIAIGPHSIWVCVEGGTDADVAAALLGSKSAGANWKNGNAAGAGISVPVTDPTSGQIYTVLFDRPDDIPVLYRVTIAVSAVSNSEAIVKQAIVDYTDGLLGGQEGLVVGADVSPFEAAGAVNIVEPAIQVTNVEVTTVAAANFQPATITIELFELASIQGIVDVQVIVA